MRDLSDALHYRKQELGRGYSLFPLSETYSEWVKVGERTKCTNAMITDARDSSCFVDVCLEYSRLGSESSLLAWKIPHAGDTGMIRHIILL